MTEDEMLSGLLDAFALAGWAAWHVRRSDRALWQGTPGWPDIAAVPKSGPLLVIEAKSAKGILSDEQAVWLARLHHAGVTIAVVRPDLYDRAIALILRGDSKPSAWSFAFRP